MRPSLALLLLAACASDEQEPVDTEVPDTEVGTRTFTLRFAGEVGDEGFDCRKRYEGVGASSSSVRVTDLRFYVHDVALRTADGASHALALASAAPWQDGTVALVDLEDAAETCAELGTAATNAVVTGDAPDLDYTGVSFAIGVPAERNHPEELAAPPLDEPTMFRNATAGFWFFRTGFTSSGQPDGWPVWIGSAGCTVDGSGTPTCTAEDVVTFSLDGFDPDASTIVVDVGELVRRADLEHNGANPGPAGPPGCQSVPNDTDCNVVVFPDYGLSTTPPTFVRVE
jgi:uncharacterized repeat protein (TIGR04052 family)